MNNERFRLLAALTDSSVWMASNHQRIQKKGHNRFVVSRDLAEQSFIFHTTPDVGLYLLMRDRMENPVSEWFTYLPWGRVLKVANADKFSLKLDAPGDCNRALFLDIKGDPETLSIMDGCDQITLGTFAITEENKVILLTESAQIPLSHHSPVAAHSR